MMMNDDELAEQMLKEENERVKFDWHRFAHYFSIHTYSQAIKRDDKNEVVKCKYCKVLHLTPRELKWNTFTFGAICFIGGLILGPVGWICLFSGKLVPGIILGTIGTLGIFVAIKRFLENFWMV